MPYYEYDQMYDFEEPISVPERTHSQECLICGGDHKEMQCSYEAEEDD